MQYERDQRHDQQNVDKRAGYVQDSPTENRQEQDDKQNRENTRDLASFRCLRSCLLPETSDTMALGSSVDGRLKVTSIHIEEFLRQGELELQSCAAEK